MELAQNGGGNEPVKLTASLKYVEKNKPDIICIQEAANNVAMIRGYNEFVASGGTSPSQHGAVT